MTCIVAVKDDNKIIVGGDLQGSSSWEKRERADKKVFKKDNMVFGFTSSYRMGQLIQYELNIPLDNKEIETFKYMVSSFVPALQDCLKQKQYASLKDNVLTGGTFIVGFRGRIFRIESDFQVAENVYNYDACGCGESYSLGALSILDGEKINLKQKAESALKAAALFSNGVGSNFEYAELETL